MNRPATTTIDDLLADAAISITPPAAFDVGAALRRLAADAADPAAPAPDMERSAQAGHRLGTVCRWILNGPGSAFHVARISSDDDPAPEPEAHGRDEDDTLDVEGALVYACLLHLAGHRESAEFWWQLAAGAGSRAAAYCLHLHHAHLGEDREARHWYHQLTGSMDDSSIPPDAAFIEGLEAVARYVQRHGSAAAAPTGHLEGEVDRLASRTIGTPCVIARRPDRSLVARLREFFAHRT
ncbi:hypothetical protein AB0G74_30565 [Streptomyces sp. NPDC020875]|uniref:hypothetical protein n=1 Tax=Streptomyces sp. NPDC020875 TaxID=3154898 RepID=UPI003401C6B2